MSEAVLTTTIAGGFSVLAALVGYLVKMTRRDHGQTSAKLDELLRGHERIEGKVDGHIGDHARGDV
jgi:hypothetical protein